MALLPSRKPAGGLGAGREDDPRSHRAADLGATRGWRTSSRGRVRSKGGNRAVRTNRRPGLAGELGGFGRQTDYGRSAALPAQGGTHDRGGRRWFSAANQSQPETPL